MYACLGYIPVFQISCVSYVNVHVSRADANFHSFLYCRHKCLSFTSVCGCVGTAIPQKKFFLAALYHISTLTKSVGV